MNLQKIIYNRSAYFIIPVMLVYVVLAIVSLNYCYFWDNIQQISKEAHWFYLTDFKSLLMPAQNSGAEIVATGYHPPLMGIMTAALWKVFGYELWVSHAFIFLWAVVLIYNLHKISQLLLPKKIAGWVLLIVMLEPTLLAQFSIASPDFILFTAFIISLRAVLEGKPLLLSIGIFFLCCINMRGIFVGVALFITHCYFNQLQSAIILKKSSFIKLILPYLPTLIVLSAYFVYYFQSRGWFFAESTPTDHYAVPNNIGRIIRHFAEFGLRSVENGRILIWFTGIYVAFRLWKSKKQSSATVKALILFFSLLTGLYILFIFITQMPFSARYFMPQFFLLTILVIMGVSTLFENKKATFIFILILCFEVTGNCWIYPERIAKSWDCTLAHIPYYELRKDCFNYIDSQKLNYNEISGGFCLYGNRKFIELTGNNKIDCSDTKCNYYIYSNISNVEDTFADELKNTNKWNQIKSFEKGFVKIIIYKRV